MALPRLSLVRVLACFATLTTVIVAPSITAPAQAATQPNVTTTLPLTGYTEAVMDDAHGHLFVTGYSAGSWAGYSGGADSKVVVVNTDGTVSTTISGIDGAAGMYLDAAANKLYVAAHDGNAVQVIDTATLTLGTSYALGTDAGCPYDVAKAGTFIWTNIGCGTNDGLLARLNTTTLVVKTYTVNGEQLLESNGTTLFTGRTFSTPRVGVVDVSSGTPTETAAANGTITDLNDIAVLPDGSELLTADGTADGLHGWSTADLSATHSYLWGDSAEAATVSGDGSLIAGGGLGLGIFHAGDTTPVNTFPFSEVGGTVAPQGLASNADMSVLYVITGIDNFGQGAPVLTLIHDPTVPRSTMTLTPVSDTIQVTTTADLSGTLTFTDGAAASGKTVHVSRTGPDATETALPDVTTDGSGGFSFQDVPPEAGTYTYEVSFAGSAAHRAASATAQVTAERYTSKFTISSSAHLITIGQSVKITATLKGFDPGQVVTFFAHPEGGTKHAIEKGHVDASGSIQIKVSPKGQTAYSAKSEATAAFLSSTTPNITVLVRPKIQGRMAGGYATSKGVRLYHFTTACPQHRKGCPISAFQFRPIENGSLRCVLEIKVGGKWRNAANASAKLNRKGIASVRWVYGDRSVIGLPTRVHAEYGGSRDLERARSPYVFFKVTN